MLVTVACLGSVLAGSAFASPARAAAPSSSELEAFANSVDAELRTDILPYWIKHFRNPAGPGFLGEIENDGTVRPDAPIGCLLTSRILWTYSAAYRRTKDPAYLAMAQDAYDTLQKRFWDAKDGGFLWKLSPDGRILDGRKEVYGQSFAIYGLAEYYLATGNQAALDRAIEVYHLLEKYSHDRAHGGYLEAFTRDWKRPPGARLSDIGPEYAKSQNTNLHLMEAYTNLLRAWPDAGLRTNLRQLAEVMITHVLSPDGSHLILYFDADWTPRSTTTSFGHDIEFNWLLTETAGVLGDPAFEARVKPICLKIASDTLAEGVDKDGGLMNEANPAGVITDGSKEWWQQAEALTGFINAYQLSGDPEYYQAARGVWRFIETHLIDHEHGEWYWGVERDGSLEPHSYNAGFWKCPYHNSRCCMEASTRLWTLAAESAGAQAPN